MRDGIHTSADIYLPDDASPCPVILNRTPYGNNTPNKAQLGEMLARQGYIYVTEDVRGRGDSDGRFEPYFQEAEDGYDSLQWCGHQPWCNGKIGLLGTSYDAFAHLLAAQYRHPSLKAMVSVACPPLHPFRNFVLWDGVPGTEQFIWGMMVHGRSVQCVDRVDWLKVLSHRPISEIPEKAGYSAPRLIEDLAHDTLDSYWRRLFPEGVCGEIDVPVLHLSGWYDDNLLGVLSNYQGLRHGGRSEGCRQGQYLVIGPWTHQVMDAPRKVGAIDYGPEAHMNMLGLLIRWFDRWLRDDLQAFSQEPRVKLFVMGENTWCAAEDFPISGSQEVRFYLRGDGPANSLHGAGRLVRSPAEDAAEPDTYIYDPDQPTPYIFDPKTLQIGLNEDQRSIEYRTDVLVYTSEPLESALTILSPVRAELFVSTSTKDTDFIVKLCQVYSDGDSIRLCDGVSRLRYYNGLDQPPVPVVPEEIYRLEIDMWATGVCVPAGHRLRVEVASAAFPKYFPNMNTGEPVLHDLTPVIARQKVFHDSDRPSCIIMHTPPPIDEASQELSTRGNASYG